MLQGDTYCADYLEWSADLAGRKYPTGYHSSASRRFSCSSCTPTPLHTAGQVRESANGWPGGWDILLSPAKYGREHTPLACGPWRFVLDSTGYAKAYLRPERRHPTVACRKGRGEKGCWWRDGSCLVIRQGGWGDGNGVCGEAGDQEGFLTIHMPLGFGGPPATPCER